MFSLVSWLDLAERINDLLHWLLWKPPLPVSKQQPVFYIINCGTVPDWPFQFE